MVKKRLGKDIDDSKKKKLKKNKKDEDEDNAADASSSNTTIEKSLEGVVEVRGWQGEQSLQHAAIQFKIKFNF